MLKNTFPAYRTNHGISRWPRVILVDKAGELSNFDDWSEQDIGTRRKRIFYTVQQTKYHF